MNITVIYGGKSGEHEVSQVSAASVARNINTQKHTITLISISKDGKWFLQPESELSRIRSDLNAHLTDEPSGTGITVIPAGGKEKGLCAVLADGSLKPIPTDVVLNVTHGTYGEDGLMQGLLEMADLPYWGCDVTASAISMDKEKTKVVWKEAGLPVVPWVTLRKHDDEANQAAIAQAEKEFGYPLFVKPCKAGSSVGASLAHSATELKASVEEAFRWDTKILVEQCINAREIECSVTGYGDSPVTAYAVGEISTTGDHEFYDYEAKYIDPDGAKLKIPADLNDAEVAEIRKTAVRAFKVLDGSGFSRIDFFKEKTTGQVWLNELNTIPGFTSISMFPKLCEAAGTPYADVIELLIQQAIDRFTDMRSLATSR